RKLVPVSNTAEIIAREMQPQRQIALGTALSRFIKQRWSVDIPPVAWNERQLPDHLRMRIALTDAKGKIVRTARDTRILQSVSSDTPNDDFKKAQSDWERGPIDSWNIGDLTERITLKGAGGRRWNAYPALKQREDRTVVLTAFADKATARKHHPGGVKALIIKQLASDIKYLRKNLALPYSCDAKCRYFGGRRALDEQLVERVLTDRLSRNIRTEAEFNALLESLHTSGIGSWGQEERGYVLNILDTYHELRTQLSDLEKRFVRNAVLHDFVNTLRQALLRLVPETFITLYDAERLGQLPRYIKALEIRAQRGAVDMEKDRNKTRRVTPYEERLHAVVGTLSPQTSARKREALEALVWMLEEFKISIFAQEIKTAHPVSAKRLETMFDEIEAMV
ncbi:MAG: DUF3418 domain-containing protein, partial [Anaerolineae bacterium]